MNFSPSFALALCAVIALGSMTAPVFAETQSKPTATEQPTPTSGKRPSQLKEAHKALKSMDTAIPAETSKAVRNTKDAFKKRFNTTQEGGKERK